MKKCIGFAGLLLVALAVVGCPWWFVNYRFTSADLYPNGFRDNLPPGIPAAGATDGQGEGGDAGVPRSVVEPDVIRQQGNLLYVLNQYRGLTLVDLNTKSILSQVPTYGFPRDLYIAGTRAYVLVAYASDYTSNNNTISFTIQSRLYVVDISAPANARVIASFGLEGDLVDSRLVGDVLYAVSAQYQWYWAEPAVLKTQTGDSWVTSVNIANPANIRQTDQITFAGAGTVIQATDSAIFVAAPDWATGGSTITYVDISDPQGAMALRGAIPVKGQIADRFKMDAYNGVLRVVTGGWDGQRRVYITTVNLANPDNLRQMAETEFESAVGDQLFATRFDGDRAYVVTYFVVDPLYVVDLSDPSNPVVAGELEVPGWSTHIEPRGDRLIALGVDDTNGRRVSVSLFDVSNPAAPALLDRESFGDQWSWSNAYGDVKSFTVLDDVLIVPFSGWTENFGGYERLQFVSHTRNSLTPRGYVDVKGGVLRSFEYQGAYLGVTTEQLATIDGSNLDRPAVTHSLILAENTSDFVELSPSLGAELITQYNSGKTLVRTVPLTAKGVGQPLGEVGLSIGQLAAAHKYGASVVLVGTDWTGEAPRYTVAVVDCAVPGNPRVAARFDVNVQPYYGYVPLPLYDRGGGAVTGDRLTGIGMDTAIGGFGASWWWWYPWPAQPSVFLAGNTLVLRCVSNRYDQVLGQAVPTEGLALVDLSRPAWTATLGLGFNGIVSVNAAGDKLYLGTKNNAGFENARPVSAYFLREIDVESRTAGPAANVPGQFVQYDPVNDVLALRDFQWNLDGTIDNVLRTVSWNGSGGAVLIDDLALPNTAIQMHGGGSKLYYDTYDSGYWVGAVSIAPAGGLANAGTVLVTEQWGYLIAGHGNSAYVCVGNGAIARYDFSGGGTLAELVSVMGSPVTIRFGSNQAYAALGYFGLVTLGL